MKFFFNERATTEIYTYDTLFPYTTLVRSDVALGLEVIAGLERGEAVALPRFDKATDDRTDEADWERAAAGTRLLVLRSEEHTSELQSLMHISYTVFCLKKKTHTSLQSSLCIASALIHYKTKQNLTLS